MTQQVKIIVPILMGAEGLAARASQLPPRMVLSSFEPELVAVAKGAAFGDGACDALLMDFSMLEPALRAQREGHAAGSIEIVSDSGSDMSSPWFAIPAITSAAPKSTVYAVV